MFRVSKYRDRGEELLGKDEGGVELRRPQERLAWTLEGVDERSKDLRSVSEKFPVENAEVRVYLRAKGTP